ncbi:class I adenylate-forming enzyme family protein [Sphingomonas solaris]|uniref:Acyl--CoA ligase n=1 Tax=Alterirhizorhabdus solaris TaxID=2529389 RepID=A0A558RBG7_9SPHN|nr:class I adenylate-forming enzyme family protein [Sphingomonas solaris]TVV76755.1 acyl--CoA ligase [Sphingomonas solaris]
MTTEVQDASDPRAARTFPRFVRAIAAAYGDTPAVTLAGQTLPDEAMSFAGLESQSAELARGLIARGAGKGSRIGFIHGNGPAFVRVFAAIARIGAVAVPISTLIKADELVRVLRQSDVQGLIVQRSLLGHDFVARLCDALPELREATGPDLRIDRAPYLRWIVSSGDALPATIQPMSALTDAAASVSDTLLQAVEAEVHPTDQIVEIYTSGSMALPKGVRHLHGPVLFRTAYLADITERTRYPQFPISLPLFWVGGLGLLLLPTLAVGGTSLCTEGTATNSLSAMGTVLSEKDLEPMAQSRPFWGLGMSETFGPYSYGDVLRAPGHPLCAPIDHIAEGYEVRVVDAEGQPVADGGTGEIQVRGVALTPGLHKLERADYFTPDGYYRTGDLGLIEGNRIHFVGRDGDMIKAAGSNVSPAEVEMEMQQLEGIHSAYVIGLPDAERGQFIVAAVVPREGAVLDFDQVQATLRKRLSSYKVPRAYVAITREEVPMLPSNKVARRQIAAMMAKALDRPA